MRSTLYAKPSRIEAIGIVPAMAEAVEEAAHETGAGREAREEEDLEEAPLLP